MTLTQVSTWFANARRRLKKDCRTSWDSESKSLDGDEDDDDDDVIGRDDDVIGRDDDVIGRDDDVIGRDDDVIGRDDDGIGRDDDVDVECDEDDERTMGRGDNGSPDGNIHSPEREEDRLEGIDDI